MKLWIGYRVSTNEERAETSETTLKQYIRDVSSVDEVWMVRQVETFALKAPKVAEIITNLKPDRPNSALFIEDVLQEYELRMTEGGQLRKSED